MQSIIYYHKKDNMALIEYILRKERHRKGNKSTEDLVHSLVIAEDYKL